MKKFFIITLCISFLLLTACDVSSTADKESQNNAIENTTEKGLTNSENPDLNSNKNSIYIIDTFHEGITLKDAIEVLGNPDRDLFSTIHPFGYEWDLDDGNKLFAVFKIDNYEATLNELLNNNAFDEIRELNLSTKCIYAKIKYKDGTEALLFDVNVETEDTEMSSRIYDTDTNNEITDSTITQSQENENETSGEHPVSIYFHSLSAYKELFEAVNYTDEELDAFLHAYPEYHVANGIANREELLAFIKLIESTPLPFFADESVIEGFGLEYQPDAKVFDVIYGIGGQRYRFTIWDVGNEASDSIHEDSNVTTVSTHMIGDIEIGLYNSGTENIYYDSFRISNYEIEVLAYDDTKTCQFDFSGFSIE